MNICVNIHFSLNLRLRKEYDMTRREERELLTAVIFELSFYTKEEFPEIYESEKEYREFSSDYIDKCVFGILENLESIDEKISECAIKWKLSRLSRMTLAILRVSVYEMLYESLPFNISINEAVELAKKYDDDKAPSFVNGVLNKIADKNDLKK